MCFCFTSNENCHFSSEKPCDHPKCFVDFLLEKDTFRNKFMEIVEDFDEKSYTNNGKPWKSSRILRVKQNFFIFSLFIMFLHFFIVHYVSSFFHFFIFFHFLSFSLSFFFLFLFHFLSFSFIFLFFFMFILSIFHFFLIVSSCFFFFLFWVARNPIFFESAPWRCG